MYKIVMEYRVRNQESWKITVVLCKRRADQLEGTSFRSQWDNLCQKQKLTPVDCCRSDMFNEFIIWKKCRDCLVINSLFWKVVSKGKEAFILLHYSQMSHAFSSSNGCCRDRLFFPLGACKTAIFSFLWNLLAEILL